MIRPETLTEIAMEYEESRWTPERERIARAGIEARDEALISGAPTLDAAWIGIEAIDREAIRQAREQASERRAI